MKKKILAVITGVVIAGTTMFPAIGFAPTDEQLAAMNLDAPVQEIGLSDNYSVHWNQDLFLDFEDKRSAEEIATSFLRENSSILNLDADLNGLRVERVLDSGSSRHVDFQQYSDNMAVEGALIRVSIAADGRVQLVKGFSVPATDLSNGATLLDAAGITEKEAIQIAKKHIGLEVIRHARIIIKKIKYSIGAIFIPCYKVKIMAQKPLGDFTVLVNSLTGEVVNSINDMVYFEGNGKAYPNHPLAGDVKTVKLANLKDKTKLSGKFINIINDDTTGASSTDGSFNFKPEDTHFDEVGMYYYMNVIHDYFSKMGFKELDKPLNATVHYGDNYDNAYFSPWGQEFCFGDGNRLNNLAREESVAYHEYTHAVTSAITNLAYKAESGAMNEGWSDYFACTQDNDPKLGEWVMAKMNRPWMRNLDEFKKYPDDVQGEVHADGKIWGSVLWSVRKALGKEVADAVIHKGRYYINDYNAKFADGVEGVLEADEALYNGAHKEEILKVFAKHGIKPRNTMDKEALLNKAFNENNEAAKKALTH